MLPNFLVVGGQKCGTTSLHEYLLPHPDIYLPKIKETHFFADPKKYSKGIDYYENEYFSEWAGEKAVGEVDPDYIYMPEAFDRISQHMDLERLKIILLVRNPVDRAYSHYLMTYRRGLEKLSFEKAIEIEQERIAKGFYEREHFSYVDRGFYGRDVARLLEVIPSENLMVIKSDSLRNEPDVCVERVCSFLGVENAHKYGNVGIMHHEATVPRFVGINRWLMGNDKKKSFLKRFFPSETIRRKLRRGLLKANNKKNDQRINETTKATLTSVYHVDIGILAQLTGMKFDEWL